MFLKLGVDINMTSPSECEPRLVENAIMCLVGFVVESNFDFNHIDMFKFLLENGCDLNYVNTFGNTALHWLAGYGNNPKIFKILEVVENYITEEMLLVEDNNGRTPYDIAEDQLYTIKLVRRRSYVHPPII